MSDFPNRDVEVFTAAMQLPVDQRAAYLAQACGSDAQMRQRVAALLETHAHVGDFLEQPPEILAGAARPAAGAGEQPGDRIGRYKLLQQIGEGGCGVVYMAEQEEPVRRRVALKIIKPGMDTKNVIARFEAERQALALMDHPNIARVFDAGATASGRPYFVMELVRGVKITEYCDQHALTTPERLNLFIQVCQAVQQAHQKGIIHRDIKPSNILVTTTVQGTAMPVVIDFGIAKATTNQRLTDKTLFTAFEMLIGTPAYMSPEQAELSGVDVDTRTDIYSLGVLLYELLTGSTPFDAGELLKAGLDEIRRVIREQEPVSPSTRLSKLTRADLTTVAQQRQAEPPALIRVVHGDLDWIVMKALEKDRTRRYETANGMAMDVKRYLADEPISARPPSKLYKLRKAVLRNKLLFAGGTVIALLVIVSLIVVSASFAKERQAHREAEAALQLAEAGKIKAQIEAAKSQQVTHFLSEMLQGVGPSVAMGQDTTILRCILDRTADSVGRELTNQPAVEAELRGLIGRVYYEIGNYESAERMQRAALKLNRQIYGVQSPELAGTLNDLGLVLAKKGDQAAAESMHEEALGIRRQHFGETNAEVAVSLNDLATVLRHEGRLDESEALAREALAIRQTLFGTNSLEVADTLHNLTVVLGDLGKLAEAEAVAREMLAMLRQRLGGEDARVAGALNDLAWAVGRKGDLAGAEALQRQVLALQRKLLGDENPAVAKTLSALGERIRQRGDLAESDALLRAALSIQGKLLGGNNPDYLYTLDSLGSTLASEEKWPAAEVVQREALTAWRQLAGSEDARAISALKKLVRALMAQRKLSEAEQLLDQTLTPGFVQQLSNPELLVMRGELRARRSQWTAAAADISRAFELEPFQHERYTLLAALLIQAHDRPAYEQLRQRLIGTQTTNVFVADQVAKACLLQPASLAEAKMAGRLADLAVTRGADDSGALPFFQVCKALAEYRQGHYAAAAEWAQKPLPVSGINAQGHAYAVLAMAEWQLGKKAEARASLASGEALAPAVLPASIAEDLDTSWQAWLFARVTLDEAATIIQP